MIIYASIFILELFIIYQLFILWLLISNTQNTSVLLVKSQCLQQLHRKISKMSHKLIFS